MNPFFIFLLVCSTIAIIYWFKNASKSQGVTALKAVFIIVGVIIIVLITTGRLPILLGIPVVAIFLFKKFAVQQLLIPFIKMLAGNYVQQKMAPTNKQPTEQEAIDLLGLSTNPNREQIVQAHRQKLRELESQNASPDQIQQLDAAREFLIKKCDS